MALFQEYDCVELQQNFSDKLKVGQQGVVVMVYATSPAQTQAYEVEFLEENGEFIALETILEPFLRFAG